MRNFADEPMPLGEADDDPHHLEAIDLYAWRVAEGDEVDGEATVIDPEPASGSTTLPARIPDRQDDIIVAGLPARRFRVHPGEVAEIELLLVNNGRQPATFLTHVEGWFDESWLAPPAPILLQPGARASLLLEIAPPRRPETEAGDYAIVVVVRSHDYPGHTARLGAQLVILPFDGIDVAVLPAAQPALTWRRRATMLPVAVRNHGNRPATVRLQAGDAHQHCTFEFFSAGAPASVAHLTLRPGQTITTPLRVAAQHLPLIGLQSQDSPFFITASALQAPEVVRRARGAVALHPLVGPWQMASMTGLGLMAVVGLLLLTVIGLLVLRTDRSPAVVQAPASQPPPVIIVNLSQPVAAAPVQAAVSGGNGAPAASANPALPLVLPGQVTAPDGGASRQAEPVAAVGISPAGATPAAGGALTYAQMFQEIAQRFDMDWRMLAALAYIESSFDSLALSSAGAMGLMQILPNTWREWAPAVAAADPFDSYDNVLVSAAYLDTLRTRLAAAGYNGREWMLVAYNWGPERLDDFLANGGGWENLPEVRRQYAEEILRIAQSIP